MSTGAPRSRKSRLAGAMASKAVIEPEPTEERKPPLALAPEPTGPDTPDLDVPPAPAAETATAPVIEPDAPDTEPEVVPSSDPDPIVDPTPETEPKARTPRKKTAAAPADDDTGAPSQTAQVLAGTGQVVIERDLTHLRALIATGRDQRRYVEDLPHRTGKGTYLRLPVHIQDVLGEYCDRNSAPMADLITALLDSYFRDIGALPPLGEGNRPVEKFFDKMRKETRAYDY